MMLLRLTTLLSLALASSASSTHVLKERHPAPQGWTRTHRARDSDRVTLRVGLIPETPGELEAALLEISDPFHERFRQHLSPGQVDALVRPANRTLESVHSWLISEGVDRIQYSRAFDWITLPDLPVRTIERLLQAEYHIYKRDGDRILRTEAWSLPAHLSDLVDIVHPSTSFVTRGEIVSQLTPRGVVKGDLNPSSAAADLSVDIEHVDNIDPANPPADLTPETACNTSAVTPLCLRTLYGTLDYKAQSSENNSMALVNYWGEFNNRSDARLYLESYRPDAVSGADTFSIHEISGAVNQQSPATASQLKEGLGREGGLDAQVMLGIGHPTPLITYSTGGELPPYLPDDALPENTNEPYLTWLQYVLAQSTLPNVVSTSYADTEYTVPPSYAKRVCNGFAQLGARGVTVIFGAGDWGVGNPEQCHAADGSPRFVARFPDSCPWGTSVAATRDINPQIVAYNDRNGFVSGGGFSEYFPRPAYQGEEVDSYLTSLGDRYDGLYNRKGRAYPDVAAMGYRILTIWNGTSRAFDGTSASAPIFGAVVALVNDALLAAGKPVLGFLNPWLYAGGHRAFRDVTHGSTKGCDTEGFPAMKGWDSASGFGTPVSSHPARAMLANADEKSSGFRNL